MSTQTVNSFYSWSPSGHSLSVQLDYDVIERINVEVMKGFGVTRRRGTEAGGVLVGHISGGEKPVIHIQDFEVVPCEYAAGPSYVLSETDRERFRAAITKWSRSPEREWYGVGYFRSHTREGFALDTKDAELFREFFPDALDVALLIKPFATRAANAGFFLKKDGALDTSSSPLEFAFEAPGKVSTTLEEPGPRLVPLTNAAEPLPTARLVKTGAPAVAAPDSGVRVQPVLRETAAISRETTDSHRPNTSYIRSVVWALFSLALLALGLVLGLEYASRSRAPVGATSSTAPRTGMQNADLYNVQLQVTAGDGVVVVKWNRDAAAIQAALHGVLTVAEGENTRDVKLGFAEIRNGIVMYPRLAPQIRFRLELFFADNRSFVETVEFHSAVLP